MKIETKLFVYTTKKYYINLNNYRNWHYIVSNNIKQSFCEELIELRGVKLKTPIEISFTLFKGSKRKMDRSNVLSITEKFFCDALVHYGCIPDDNDDYIKSTHYYSGEMDKNNPRVEIICEEVKI